MKARGSLLSGPNRGRWAHFFAGYSTPKKYWRVLP